MNPELPQVRSGGEIVPHVPGVAEQLPDGTEKTPEMASTTPEQQISVQAEQLAQTTQAAIVPSVIASPYPSQPVTTTAAATSLAASDNNPSVAADDDLIEKEWVDKVKKIIALTKGRPYEQAQAVATLQEDYLKKRYNRELGGGNG